MANKYFLVALIAFLSESVDASLGMGYGTLLTPILLFLGYKPLEVVPLILLSEFITGILSAIFHHKKGNVNLKPGSRQTKVALVLITCSLIGTVLASYLASLVPQIIVKGYIALLLITIGIVTYFSRRKSISFSWTKIILLGSLASFNKGLSGGGYGPLVTGGQILAGLKGKNAVGITSLAEGITCLIGVISYFFFDAEYINWHLAVALMVGAILSIPVSVNFVKRIKETQFKIILSSAVIGLGLITFYQILQEIIHNLELPLMVFGLLISFPFIFQLIKRQEDR